MENPKGYLAAVEELWNAYQNIYNQRTILAHEFNMDQIDALIKAADSLTLDEMICVANPKFGWKQMREIREGFENGLTIEQVKLYARPEFDDDRMRQIRWGFENGLTAEQIAIYDRPEFDNYQMAQIRIGFENGLTAEQVAVYAKEAFNWQQMRQIREGSEHGLDESQIATYARPEFDQWRMYEICYGLKNGLTVEQVKLYAKPGYSSFIMRQIREGFEHGLTVEQAVPNDYIKSHDGMDIDTSTGVVETSGYEWKKDVAEATANSANISLREEIHEDRQAEEDNSLLAKCNNATRAAEIIEETRQASISPSYGLER